MNRDYLSLDDAHSQLTNSGVKVSRTTLNVWVSTGIKAKGRRVTLQCVKFGGRLYTTAKWIERFCDQCTVAAPPQTELPQTDQNLQFLASEGF